MKKQFSFDSAFWISALIFLLTLLVYSNVWHFSYINMDDDIFVHNNPFLQHGLTLRGIKWAFTADLTHDSANADYWQPATFFIRMLFIQFFGLKAGVHHVLNVVLHALSAIFLFLIFLKMTGAKWKSAFLAALFAVHPLQVESVCWIANLKGILNTFFAMLSLWAYVLGVKDKNKKQYAWAAIWMALAMMSKPVLIFFPFIFLLVDIWPLERISVNRGNLEEWRKLVFEKKTFFLIAGLFFLINIFEKSSILGNLRNTYRISSIPGNFIHFIWKVLYPAQLAILEAFQKMPHLFEILGAVLLLFWISVATFRKLKTAPYLFVGWLWFLITLSPVIPNAVEDRFIYFPIIGLFLIAAWGIPDLLKNIKFGKIFALGFSIFIIAAYGFFARIQTNYWQNSTVLFTHAIQIDPKNVRAYNNLACAVAEAGKTEEAIDYYTKALWLKPDHARAHSNLGTILANDGKTEVAKFHFRAAIQADPMMVEPYVNLGQILVKDGEYEEAAALYRQAIKIDPENYTAWDGFGNLFLNQEKYQDAIPYFLKALEINPSFMYGHYDYGFALAKLNRMKEAIPHFEKAIQLNPEFSGAHNRLGVALALEGRSNEAERELHEALRLSPHNEDALHNVELLKKQKTNPEKKEKLLVHE